MAVKGTVGCEPLLTALFAGVIAMLWSVSATVTVAVPAVAPPALAWIVAVPAKTPVTKPFFPAEFPTVAEPVGLLAVTVQVTDCVTSLVLLSS